MIFKQLLQKKIHILLLSSSILLVAPSIASAQSSTVQKGFIGNLSIKVYCTFSPIFNHDNSKSICQDNIIPQVSSVVTVVKKPVDVVKQTASSVVTSNSNTQKQPVYINTVTSSGNSSTPSAPQIIYQTPQTIITNPIREVRTIIEYRGAAVGPQGPIGPQGPQGIPGTGQVVYSGGGGTTVISSPVLGGSGLTIANSVISGSTFSGANVFSTLPTLPLSQGAILVGNASSTASQLLPGSTGQVLIVNASGTPVWTTAAALSGSTTNALSFSTSSGNTLTSTVNGLATSTQISELSNILLSGTTTSNGVINASKIVTSLFEAVTGVFTNLFASVANFGNVITSNITATGTASFATTTATNINAGGLLLVI